jgi:LysR family nitrogen assimilation transcriptional regulator
MPVRINAAEGEDVSMDLLALEYFVEVSQARGFSIASAIIKVSQPTLSRHIRQLEEELNARLFSRTGHGVELTEAGETLLRHARPLLARARQARAEVTDTGSHPSESVVLGLAPAAGRILNIPVAKRFVRDLPNGQLRIVECFTSFVQEWVTSGRIDIGIVYEDSVQSPLESELLWDERYHLVVPRDSEWAQRTSVDFSDIARIPLVLPGVPHGLRLKIDRTAAARQVQLDVLVDVDGLNTLLDLVRRGVACTILTRPALHNFSGADELRVVQIANPIISSTAILIRSFERPITNTTRKLVQIIRDEAREIRYREQS